jgi:hypothetical protein
LKQVDDGEVRREHHDNQRQMTPRELNELVLHQTLAQRGDKLDQAGHVQQKADDGVVFEDGRVDERHRLKVTLQRARIHHQHRHNEPVPEI